ncbi:amidohydrolase family protein [Microbacterium sp. 18062]|uniref:amidohydrolase family protein n=1 Tax=Microbacterium sp. 18062 TaxID=2681410 RepID=UPI00190FA9A7|nr:amidohydrolase family protein [Microbacterium sp. 18062]
MTTPDRPYLRIATEEAFAPPEMFALYSEHLRDGTIDDIGFNSLVGYFLGSPHPQPRWVVDRLEDLGAARIADMDAAGIDHQVLALTAPGTQVLDAKEGARIARIANDRAAEACDLHPDRFSALAAVSFEDAGTAVAELERGVTQLGLKGLIANSHVRGAYLSEDRFTPIVEALVDLDVPLYLHPTTPPNDMIAPFLDAGLDGAVFGFGVETGFHLLRLITSGLLDRFPGLKVVVGHLGEALPFWIRRIDHMHAKQVAAARYAATGPLRQKPSEYLRTNVWITTSGMPWTDPIMFVRHVVGADRVMYAMDYPYQYDLAEVAEQDALPISDADKADFFENTARRVFDLTF